MLIHVVRECMRIGLCLEDKDDGNKTKHGVFAGERDSATMTARPRLSKHNEVGQGRSQVPACVEQPSLWIKRSLILLMFFSKGHFAKESFMHPKFGGLSFFQVFQAPCGTSRSSPSCRKSTRRCTGIDNPS